MLLPPDRRRSLRDVKVAGAYVAGTLAGALLTGLALWALSGFGSPLGAGARAAAVAVAGVVFWLVEHGPLADRYDLPEARRQIPADVFGAPLARGAWQFGFELGTGVRTYLPSAAPYILAAAVLALRPILAEAVVMAVGFGIGRASPILVQLVGRTGRGLLEDPPAGMPVFSDAVAPALVVLGAIYLA